VADSVQRYTAEFIDRVFAFAPASLVDIGCGQGDFLLEATKRGIRAAGVDTNPERVAAARDRGLDVRQADAEHLPFEDGAFEWCTCMRSAHHFGDLKMGLKEAFRVAAKGVLIYDPWYDEGIPSQATAAKLDRWYKRTDSGHGHVNNGPFSAADFISALPLEPRVEIDVTYRLLLLAVDINKAEGEIREHLSHNNPHTDHTVHAAELDPILDEARRTGISEAGALFLTIRKVSR
jgi:SAM-dependent methyltransferase